VKPLDLVQFAVTALVRHRLRSAMSLLGVAIGVTAVVLLTALGEGARRYVIEQFSSLGTNLVIVIPGKNETTGAFPGVIGVPNDLTLRDAEALRREIPQIRILAPMSMGNDTIAYHERRRQVAIIGSTHDFLAVRELKMARGQFLPPGDLERGDSVAVLGMTVARELFPDGSAVGKVVRVGEWRMRVIGVVEPTGTSVGLDMDEVVVVPVATGLRMFNSSSLFRILLKLYSHEDTPLVCPQVVAVLEERHDEEDVTCLTQKSVVSSLSSILTRLTAALGGIAAVSLAVAGIGIMNLMLVSVSERTAEVGLLKAVGAQNRQILAVFLAEAILLSSLGGLVGLSFGWLLVRLLGWMYPAFPAASPLWAIGSAFVLSVAVGAIFGVLPARRATRLDPVTALTGR